jgi:hypothetical protein
MSFHLEESASGSRPTSFQFNSEIAVGMGEAGAKKSYTLHNLTFDQVSLRTGGN